MNNEHNTQSRTNEESLERINTLLNRLNTLTNSPVRNALSTVLWRLRLTPNHTLSGTLDSLSRELKSTLSIQEHLAVTCTLSDPDNTTTRKRTRKKTKEDPRLFVSIKRTSGETWKTSSPLASIYAELLCDALRSSSSNLKNHMVEPNQKKYNETAPDSSIPFLQQDQRTLSDIPDKPDQKPPVTSSVSAPSILTNNPPTEMTKSTKEKPFQNQTSYV